MSSISNQDAHQGGDLNDMAKDGTKSGFGLSSCCSAQDSTPFRIYLWILLFIDDSDHGQFLVMPER